MVTIPRQTEPTVLPRPISGPSKEATTEVFQKDVTKGIRGKSLEQFGGQVEELSNILSDISLKIQQDQNEETSVAIENELNKFTLDWEQRYKQDVDKVLADPTNPLYQNFHKEKDEQLEQETNDFFDRIVKERTLTDIMKNRLQSQLQGMRLETGFEDRGVERTRITSSTLENLNPLVDKYINDVISNPDLYETNLRLVSSLLDQHKNALGGEEYIKYKEKIKDDFAIAMITGRIRSNPEQTLIELYVGEYDKILPPDEKLKAISATYAEMERRVRLANAEDKRRDRERDLQQEKNYGQALVAIVKGKESGEETIGEKELIDMLDFELIDSTQYSNLLKFRRNDLEVSDPETFVSLQIGILSGDFGLKEIDDSADSLSNKDHLDLVNLTDTVRRRGGIVSGQEYEDAVTSIYNVVGGTSPMFAQLDDAEARRVKNALDMLFGLVNTGMDVREARDKVLLRFPPPQGGESLASLAKSSYWNGAVGASKKELLDEVQNARARIWRDFRAISGRPMGQNPIDIEEAIFEGKIITQYEDVINRMSDVPLQKTRGE